MEALFGLGGSYPTMTEKWFCPRCMREPARTSTALQTPTKQMQVLPICAIETSRNTNIATGTWIVLLRYVILKKQTSMSVRENKTNHWTTAAGLKFDHATSTSVARSCSLIKSSKKSTSIVVRRDVVHTSNCRKDTRQLFSHCRTFVRLLSCHRVFHKSLLGYSKKVCRKAKQAKI